MLDDCKGFLRNEKRIVSGRATRHCHFGQRDVYDFAHVFAGADNVGSVFRSDGLRGYSFDKCVLVACGM